MHTGSETPSNIRRSWHLPLLAGGGVLLLLFVWSEHGNLFSWLEAGRNWLLAWLVRIPLWTYLLCFLILPAFGFPLLAFYLTIGAMVDDRLTTLLLAWTCMAGNMALSYGVTRILAAPLRCLLTRHGYRIPDIPAHRQPQMVALLRLSPLPWLLQSYLLTLGGTRFVPYMLYGVPVQAMVGLGVILFGEALFNGDAQWAFLALFLILGVALTRSHLQRRRQRLLAQMEIATTPES